MNETTPNEITPSILAFCRGIDPTQAPIFVTVLPVRDAIEGYCFPSVAEKIQRDGGSIQYGWIIWEWPGFMLDAEFHAVWSSPDGTLVDIVPKGDGEQRILFLPDSHRTWANKLVPNKRKALRNDPVLADYIDVNNRADELAVQYCTPDGRRSIPSIPTRLLLPLEIRKLELSRRLGIPLRLPLGIDADQLLSMLRMLANDGESLPPPLPLIAAFPGPQRSPSNPRERAEQRQKERRKLKKRGK